MIEIVACFVAVGAVAWATAAAGRLVGISLTAVGSGLMAFLMPPVFSFRVESNAGIAALVVNSVAGLLVVHTIKPRRAVDRVATSLQGPAARPPAMEGSVLASAILRTIERDATLRVHTSDISVHVDQDSRASIATDDLDRILLDILRIAFSHANVHRIDVYSCRRPGEIRIRVSAEYAVRPAYPHLRITGQSDDCCATLTLSNWPDACSATWFDNGFEFIYQLRIKHFAS